MPNFPEVALTAPVIVAEVETKAPVILTENGAEANVALPRYIPLESALKTLSNVPIVILQPVIVGEVIEILAETVAALTFRAFTNDVVTVLQIIEVTPELS